MRIRTIKPEFWTHEGLCGLPEFSRLMAIALLNWADDEGYFFANPAILRGSLFPFDDDSTKVRRSLDDLSSVGWIKLGTDSQGRLVGRVLNFRKHQRIDRPKRSEIKASWVIDDESTIDRRLIDDKSTGEGKGMEGKGTGNGREQGREGSTLARVESWPAMEDVKAFAQTLCASPECAEKFWHEMEGVGWQRKGTPVVNWRPIFTVYAQAWKSNEARDRKRNRSREFKPPTGGFHEE